MTGYMTQYRKSKSKGESAYLIKFARTRARVGIKKRILANIRKNDVKIIRIIVGQGGIVAKFSVRQNSRFAFSDKFSRFLSIFLSPRVLRPQF